MRGEILNQDGDILTVRIFDKLDEEQRNRFEIDGKLYAMVELFDPESITVAQRNHIYALFKDMSVFTGYPEEHWERYMKVNFMHHEMLPDIPSLKYNAMSKATANNFIEYIIIFCIQNEIPFRKNQYYLTGESAKVVYYLLMNRLCVVCGKEHAEIHHTDNLVGMGQDRRKYNHLNSGFLSLCRTHHDEAHVIGLDNFNEKYILKPIKLKEREFKQLGIQGDFSKGEN